jgi:hypothetical protein
LGQRCCAEISTFHPQSAGALLIPLCAVDTGSFHSRRGEFSTINPQGFPVITHRLCTLSASGPPLHVEGESRDVVKIPFTTPPLHRAPIGSRQLAKWNRTLNCQA